MSADAIDMQPSKCPGCGGKAWFRYTREREARLGAPICGREHERQCPGYAAYEAAARKEPKDP